MTLRPPGTFARLLLTTLLFALLLLAPLAAAQGNGNGNGNGNGGGGDDGGNGNSGTIKVHDEADADPDQRNEPHVDCEDFWVEGFNMAVDSGDLTFYSWPPTGDKTVVLEAEWEADDAEPAFHFLAGPFTLEPGHYRVEASNAEKNNGDGDHTKKKMFWVDECEDAEEPAPELACPTQLEATPNGDGSITLTWVDAEGSDATNVYRATGDGDFEFLDTVSAGVESYDDITTTVGATYSYTVTALFGSEESVDCPVAEVTAIPEFPTVLAMGLASSGGLLAIALAGRRKK